MSSVWEWWWIRHAPVPDAPPCLGWTDAPADLSDGAALDALAGRLPRTARWLSSDLRRAHDTAMALGAPSGLHMDPAFREQRFGAWEGRGPAPDEQARVWRDPAAARPQDGESFVDLCGRIRAAVEAAHAAGPGVRIVVAHAGVIRAALVQALDLAPAAGLSIAIAPLSVTRLAYFGPPSSEGLGGGWSVSQVNWTPEPSP